MENQNQSIIDSSEDLQRLSSNLVRRGLDGYGLLPAHYPIRIMHVDDVRETRDFFKKQIKEIERVEVIASTGSSIEALGLYQQLKPDIVVQDISRPEMDGITMTRKLRELDPHSKSFTLSVSAYNYLYKKMLRDAGAMGIMNKPPFIDELIDNIDLIHQSKPGAVLTIESSFSEQTCYLTNSEFLSSAEVQWDSSSRFFKRLPLLHLGVHWEDQGKALLENIPIDRFEYLDLDFPKLEIVDFHLIYKMKKLKYIFLPEHLIRSLGNSKWQEIKTEIVKKLYNLQCIYIGNDLTYTRN